MSPISEIENENIGANGPDDGILGDSNGGNICYMPGFQLDSWDSALVSKNFSDLKRARDTEKMLSGLNPSATENGEVGNCPPGLTHHFSLPKTSTEIVAMEKFLQFQDSVPCKIRAKRGCATHPWSIAERVRRTRISERMRKLQELVPNMDKVTCSDPSLSFFKRCDDLGLLYRKIVVLSDENDREAGAGEFREEGLSGEGEDGFGIGDLFTDLLRGV